MSTFKICLTLASVLFSWGIVIKTLSIFFPKFKNLFHKVFAVLMATSTIAVLLGVSWIPDDLVGSLVCFSVLFAVCVSIYGILFSCYRDFKQVKEKFEVSFSHLVEMLISLYETKDKTSWFRENFKEKDTTTATAEETEDPADWWKQVRRRDDF
jgi:hypothetical protein